MTANQDANLHAEVSRAAVWAAMLEGLRPAGQRAMVANVPAHRPEGKSANLQSTAISQADAAEMLNAANPARWTLIVNWLLGRGWPMPTLPVHGTRTHTLATAEDTNPADGDPLLDMTASEIARMKGVSRQRGHQILAAARAAADMRARVEGDDATHPSPPVPTPAAADPGGTTGHLHRGWGVEAPGAAPVGNTRLSHAESARPNLKGP
jgi:hypothetical protein